MMVSHCTMCSTNNRQALFPVGLRAITGSVSALCRKEAWSSFDIVIASSGNDHLVGKGVLFGLAGDDGLIGSTGSDALYGDAGNDWLDGGAGADLMDGGAGWDVVSYQSATSGITVDLTT